MPPWIISSPRLTKPLSVSPRLLERKLLGFVFVEASFSGVWRPILGLRLKASSAPMRGYVGFMLAFWHWGRNVSNSTEATELQEEVHAVENIHPNSVLSQLVQACKWAQVLAGLLCHRRKVHEKAF